MAVSQPIQEIELRKIRPNRLNPRLEVNIERLNELTQSIKQVGLLEPIIVRPANDEFEVVVGERRYRASQQAGLEKVSAIVRPFSDDEVVQLNLIENTQREELSAIEKGKVCKYLLENCPEKYPSQNVIAEKIGVSRDAVSLWLQSVEVVPKEVQTLVAPSSISGHVPEGKIDYATAVRAGRKIREPERQVEVIKKLAEQRLPIRERTQIIERMAREPEKSIEEVIQEVVESPHDLLFNGIDRRPILEGKKTQTSRITIPDPKIKAGAVVHASISEPHFAELKITSIERKRLRYFNEEDAAHEGGYTLKEFKKIWRETYGDWNEDQLVYIIHFERIIK
jgi:ParB family chromosome partitioning protein